MFAYLQWLAYQRKYHQTQRQIAKPTFEGDPRLQRHSTRDEEGSG